MLSMKVRLGQPETRMATGFQMYNDDNTNYHRRDQTPKTARRPPSKSSASSQPARPGCSSGLTTTTAQHRTQAPGTGEQQAHAARLWNVGS